MMKSDHIKNKQYTIMESLSENGDFSILTKDSFNSHEILQNFLKKNNNELQFYSDVQQDSGEINQNFQSFATPMNIKQGQKQSQKTNISFCPEHPTKLARYYTQSNFENKICSKCALKLALQGQQIQEDLNEEEKFRKQQTEQFLQRLKSMIQENELIQSKLNTKQKELTQNYSLQAKLINNQFKQIQLHLVEFKRELLKKLNNYQLEQQRTFDELDAQTKSSASEITIVLNDILKNYDDIVKDIATGPFINILQQYSDKLEAIALTQNKRKQTQFTIIQIDQSLQQQIAINKLIEIAFKHSISCSSLFEPLNFVMVQKKRQTAFQNRDKSSETRISQENAHNKHQPFQLSISNILKNVLSDEKDTSLLLNSTQIKYQTNNCDYGELNRNKENQKDEIPLKSPRQQCNYLSMIKSSQFIGENYRRNRDILGSLQTEGNISQLYEDKIDEVNVTTAKFTHEKNKKMFNNNNYQTCHDLNPQANKIENKTISHSHSKEEHNYSSTQKIINHGDKSPIQQNKTNGKKKARLTQLENKQPENSNKQSKINLQNNNNANAGTMKILKHFLPQKCKNYTDLFQQTKQPFKQIQIINLNSFNQNKYQTTQQ